MKSKACCLPGGLLPIAFSSSLLLLGVSGSLLPFISLDFNDLVSSFLGSPLVGERFPDIITAADVDGCGEFDGDVLNLISDFLITIFSPGGDTAGLSPLDRPVGLLLVMVGWLNGVATYLGSTWSRVIFRYSSLRDSMAASASLSSSSVSFGSNSY